MVSLHACVLVAALAGSGDLVLLDFGADWCAPCRGMEPTLQRLEGAGYPVRRVNVDQSPELARRFTVGPIPCFVLVKDGREVQRMVGATSYDRLVQMFRQAGYGGASPGNGGARGQSPDRSALPAVQPARPHTVPLPNTPPPGNRFADSTSQIPRPVAATPSNATSSSQTHSTQAHRLALQATVRLQVSDPTGRSKGTGTIIDVHGSEALVLTCGHIFRESRGKGEIQVELFAPGTRGPVSGHLLVYECEQRDFALVSIRPDVSVTPVKVAMTTYHPQQGEPIFSVGCDHGANPTVRVSTISSVDRYVGPPNIEIHGHPVEGRSGGGLFTADGSIIGICNAADLQEDRGIYAALPTIYLALDKIGQREIYLGQQSAPETMLAGGTPNMPLSGTTGAASRPSAMAVVNPASHRTPSVTQLQPEMICVVRSPDGTSRVMVVKNPSANLLRQMAVESQQQGLPARPQSSHPERQGIARLSELPSTVPIVRAQGN